MIRIFCYFFSLLIIISCKKNQTSVYKSKYNLPYVHSFQGKFPKENIDSTAILKAKIKAYIDTTWLVDDGMSGGLLVAQNGKIIYSHYQGFSNYEKQKKITSNTPIHIASISKVFTATAILKLVDAQKIDLSTTVQKILPSFPYPEINIRELLNHRSGLPKYEYFTTDEKVWNKEKILSNQAILDLLAQHKFPLMFKPNKNFTYCNTNYAILALILEKITKLPYETAMQEMIFKPLAMKNTYVFNLKRDSMQYCQSYLKNWEVFQLNYLDNIYGDKNIYTTPEDLLKFDLATYNEDFLSPTLKAQVYKGYSYEKIGVKNYGLGIRLKEWPTGEKLIYHTGWWHGNNAEYIHLNKYHATIIVLGNLYNKHIYTIESLATLFDNYPIFFDPEKEDAENEKKEIELAQQVADSIKKRKDSLSKLKKHEKTNKIAKPKEIINTNQDSDDSLLIEN